jgi:multidrug resistance protein, MATE family
MSPSRTYLDEARRTLALAGPIIVGQVSQMLMGVTDSIMIGQVGKVPLAASAFAGSVWVLAYIIGIGLLAPVSVLVSRAHGAKCDAECGEWLQHGVGLALIVSVAATVVLLVAGAFLDVFGQPPEVLAEVHPYYELIAVSLLPTLVFQAFRQYAESLGRPVGPMLIMLAGVALNAGLNWVLIYGELGAPALGLAGAGWATLLSRIATVVAIVAWLRTQFFFRPLWPASWRRGLTRAHFRAMLDIGGPAAASLLFEVGAFTAAAWMMGWLGATALAAHQIAISCAGFTFMFPLGLSMAVSMRIGRAVGERRLAALRPIALGALAMSALVMGTFALVFALAGEPLARAFVREADVIALATQLLVVAALFQLFDGSQVVATGALRGLADVKVPTVITLVAYWGVALPVAYWLGVHETFGAIGIWAALAAGLAIAAVSLIARFLRLAERAAAGAAI